MSLHEKAQILAKNYLECERELIEVLNQIDKERLFEKLGFSSLFRYALSLGLSENQAYILIGVARKCREVPELKIAIDTGVLTSSQAKRILPVVNAQNSHEWIEKASTLRQKEIERLVVQSCSDNKTIELKCRITPELEEKIRRAKEIVSQSKQSPCDLVKTLEEIVEFYLKAKDPVQKAKRAKGLTLRQVPSHKRYIPKPIIHTLMKRFNGQCQAKEPDGKPCSSRQFVHIHHIKPLHEGGTHSLENLTLLCSAHHRILHRYPAGLTVPKP